MLLILLSGLAGSASFYLNQLFIRKSFKKAIEQGFDKEIIETIIIDKEKVSELLHFIKPHEFRYQEFIYDIVEQNEIDGKIHFKVINDTKEKQLIDIFTKQKTEGHRLTIAIKFFQFGNLSLIYTIASIFLLNALAKDAFEFIQFNQNPLQYHLSPPTPPPRFT